MKEVSTETRKLCTEHGEIVFTLEIKDIKNINLRIRHNGEVYVSAPINASKDTIDSFVMRKSKYIRNAIDSFRQNDISKYDMQYISGENVTFLGKNIRIKVKKDTEEYVSYDGIFICIHVKRPDYYNCKKNLFNNWLNEQCDKIFSEIIKDIHERFAHYNVPMPELRLRNMTSRWGSCLPNKGIITLNKRLIEAPKNCIEYVVYHELCHFIHPNHSKQFYSLLQIMLPDWKNHKQILENSLLL